MKTLSIILGKEDQLPTAQVPGKFHTISKKCVINTQHNIFLLFLHPF